MKLKTNKDALVNKILTPIGKLRDSCILTVQPDNIHSVTESESKHLVLYTKLDVNCDIGKEKEITLNIPKVSKLKEALNSINSEDIELDVNSNNITYKSNNISFKYHLLEDGIISKCATPVNKIKTLTFGTSFKLTTDNMSMIAKGYTFSNDSGRGYLYMKDNKLYFELADRNTANTDSVSYFITDKVEGDVIESPFIISIPDFKNIAEMRTDFTVKLNHKRKALIFNSEKDDHILKYFMVTKTK